MCSLPCIPNHRSRWVDKYRVSSRLTLLFCTIISFLMYRFRELLNNANDKEVWVVPTLYPQLLALLCGQTLTAVEAPPTYGVLAACQYLLPLPHHLHGVCRVDFFQLLILEAATMPCKAPTAQLSRYNQSHCLLLFSCQWHISIVRSYDFGSLPRNDITITSFWCEVWPAACVSWLYSALAIPAS